MHDVTHPEVHPRTTRMEIKYAAVKLYPLSADKTRISAAGSVDPKLQKIPAWLINWVSPPFFSRRATCISGTEFKCVLAVQVATKVCSVGMRMWESNAKRIAHPVEGKKECAHRQRMREDPEFYGWMSQRVSSCIAALPVHAPLNLN